MKGVYYGSPSRLNTTLKLKHWTPLVDKIIEIRWLSVDSECFSH